MGTKKFGNRLSVGLAVAVSLVGLVACQMSPTRVHETREVEWSAFTQKSKAPLRIDDSTVLLDARSEFDYGLKHIAGSVRLEWQDLVLSRKTGELNQDQKSLMRKLTLMGLEPSQSIVIFGDGTKGQGEEGRLAWNLLYLGFTDIQVSAIRPFEKKLTVEPAEPRANTQAWQLKPKSEFILTANRFRQLAHDPAGRIKRRIFLIDVRSATEYFNKKKGAPNLPDFHALNIEWKEFFTDEGRVNFEIKNRLKDLKVNPDDEIVVYSQRGLRAGAAAYSLMALGFRAVRVFRLSAL